MHAFAALCENLDLAPGGQRMQQALLAYLSQASAADAAWACRLLWRGSTRDLPLLRLPLAALRDAACQLAGVDALTYAACLRVVGDEAETIAHIVPAAGAAPVPHAATGIAAPGLAQWMTVLLPALQQAAPGQALQQVQQWWLQMASRERWLLNKLVTGGYRTKVTPLALQRALAQHAGVDTALMAQRLQHWTRAGEAVDLDAWHALVAPDVDEGAALHAGGAGQPYPFPSVQTLPHSPQSDTQAQPPATLLGPVQAWLLQPVYGGLPVQLVKRQGQAWLWTPTSELLNDRCPELLAQAHQLPDGTVLLGELVRWRPCHAAPAPVRQLMQPRRPGKAPRAATRKTSSSTSTASAAQAGERLQLRVHDLLEHGAVDCRQRPLLARQAALQQMLAAQGAAPIESHPSALHWMPALRCTDWLQAAALRDAAQAAGAAGVLWLSLLPSPPAEAGAGPAEPAAWLWKSPPALVQAVLVYAQRGPGGADDLPTETDDDAAAASALVYTFALWNRAPASAAEVQQVLHAIDRGETAPPADSPALHLVPITKTSQGLNAADAATLAQAVKTHKLQRFGPVTSLRPSLVVCLAYDSLATSPRHKSGLQLHAPRMLHVCAGLPLLEADNLGALRARCPAR